MAARNQHQSTGKLPAAEPIHRQVCAKIRALRRSRGWTLAQLAEASGVSRSMLSQVERGIANPTLTVAFRIAQAFDLSLGDLVVPASSGSLIEVVRAGDRTNIFRDDDCCRIRTLSPLALEKDVECYEVILHANQVLASAPHFAGTREFLTVGKGAVEVRSGSHSAIVKKGDSAQYPADVAHSIRNLNASDTYFYLVDIYLGDSTRSR